MQCDFNLQHYKECIYLAKDKGYSIIPVKDYQEQKKVILLRHDIDFSLEYAYELANFEYDLGICSSYYVYLHSELYNALSPKSMGMLRAMKGMGHEIGLHYDSRYDLQNENRILNDIAGDYNGKMPTVTQHFPAATKAVTYYAYYFDKNGKASSKNPNDLPIKYISDSGRNWRSGCMCNHIGKVDKLHINTHSEWWISNSNSRMDMCDKLAENISIRNSKDIGDVRSMLHDYERDLGL